MLKPNIQLFADAAADGQPAEPAAEPAQKPAGQTFTAEYVSALRNESAGYRTRAKTAEGALRRVFGMKEGEDLGDLNARLDAFQQNQQQSRQAALEAANARIIRAEMKNLTGYHGKLLEKLIDLSHVTVKEDGSVEGLKEAAEQAAKDYPQVRILPPPFSRGSQGPSHGAQTDNDKANAAIRSFLSRESSER